MFYFSDTVSGDFTGKFIILLEGRTHTIDKVPYGERTVKGDFKVSFPSVTRNKRQKENKTKHNKTTPNEKQTGDPWRRTPGCCRTAGEPSGRRVCTQDELPRVRGTVRDSLGRRSRKSRTSGVADRAPRCETSGKSL